MSETVSWLRRPKWHDALTDMPTFADEGERDSAYLEYIKGIKDEQWHGIRTGPNTGEVLILHEKPGYAVNVEPGSGFAWWDWRDDPRSTLSLALLRWPLGHTTMDLLPEVDLLLRFRDTIVTRLPDAEWTLTFDFIREWVNLVKGTS